MEEARKTMRQVKQLRDKASEFDKLSADYDDAVTMINMAIDESDDAFYPEARDMARRFVEEFEELRFQTLLSGEHDGLNAIITLHSGAGGTEACDWTEMLFRMYAKWAEKRGYSLEVMDNLPGEEAGIKSVSFMIEGDNAYGYMKCEKGVHRLVRISPFDSSGRRHTSFASCDVMPEMDDSIVVDINPDDLKVDTYRSSGAGGQHVNKTSSAIRITHLPTGIVVQCQNERSQHKNKDFAMKMLRSKIYDLKQRELLEKAADVRGEVKDIGWSSQIRSYVFHPYSMVKDHRTQCETGNVQAVMDGGLDRFMNEYLIWSAGGERDGGEGR
jgi:peptide chain release factor 2